MAIIGASFDEPADNRAFADSQRFPFRLLSDLDHAVGESYGVARDASDKFANFPRRHSFLIDPDGLIRRTYDVTDVADHASHVIADVEDAKQAR